MDWIKKNYDQFSLALSALILLASSVMLILAVLDFNRQMTGARQEIQHNNTIAPFPMESLESASATLAKPAVWGPKPGVGSLFVSKKYLLKGDELVSLDDKTMLRPPVLNTWFTEHNLDITDPDILSEDPDHDGFSNLDEWNAGTDPNDPNSHPAYTTKLRLKKFIKVPFRMKFLAYDGDPKNLDSMTFQINAIDTKQPSQFRKLGEVIEGTGFKLTKFAQKKFVDANGVEHDVSELTVENPEEGKMVVLILEKVVDSPDSYAVLKYLWNGDEIKVKKDLIKPKTFTLKPTGEEYKLIDISDSEALIENSKGEKIKIPRLEEAVH